MLEKLDNHALKDLRTRAKMSAKQMADYLGVSVMTINRWERGKARPSQLALRQLHRLHKKINGE